MSQWTEPDEMHQATMSDTPRRFRTLEELASCVYPSADHKAAAVLQYPTLDEKELEQQVAIEKPVSADVAERAAMARRKLEADDLIEAWNRNEPEKEDDDAHRE